MTLEELSADLPKECNVGSKKNSTRVCGNLGGLHLDVAEGQIPVSCILTSASLHGSQAAIPLAELSAQRITNLYDLMDSAYDAGGGEFGSTTVVWDTCPSSMPTRAGTRHGRQSCKQRKNAAICCTAKPQKTCVSRAHHCGKGERAVEGRVWRARMVGVRGNAKVMCHPMFGIVALTADQILRLVT